MTLPGHDLPCPSGTNVTNGGRSGTDVSEEPPFAERVAFAQKFGRDVSWVLAMDLGAVGIGLVVEPLLARALGPDALGLYTFVLTVIGFSLLVGNLGLSHALVKYVASAFDARAAGRDITVGLLLSVTLGGVTGFTVFAFRAEIASTFDMPQLAQALPIIMAALPLSSFFVSAQGALNGLRSMRSYAVLGLLHRAMTAGLVLGLLALGLGLNSAMWGIALSEGVCAVAGILTVRRHLTLAAGRVRSAASRLVAFGVRMSANDAANALLSYTDILMVGYFLAEADVGYYGIAVLFVSLVPKVAGAVQRISFPVAAASYGAGDMTGLRRMAAKSMQFSARITTILGLGLAFLASDIVELLFGPAFLPAVPPLLVLLVARTVRGGTVVPVGNVLPAVGRPGINLAIELAATAMNIVLNALLIPRLGLVGAALATSVSLLVACGVAIAALVKVAAIEVDVGWYGRLAIMAATLVAVFCGLRVHVSHFILTAGLLTAAAAYLWWGLTSEEDRAVVRMTVRRAARR